MGEALIAGLLAAGWGAPTEIAVVELLAARRDELTERFPGVLFVDAPVPCEGAIVAVKPNQVEDACRALAAAGVERALSIAAAIRIDRLEDWLGPAVRVVRAMPNTPAQIGVGAAAIAPGHAATDDDMVWAESLLGAVGTVTRLPEGLLDAVTGLSGSGPAYVFLLAEAMTDAGVAAGLPRDVSEALTIQTVLGAARLLVESGQSAADLRAAVTSPNGTTQAAIAALEERNVRAAFEASVAAATERAREMGLA